MLWPASAATTLSTAHVPASTIAGHGMAQQTYIHYTTVLAAAANGFMQNMQRVLLTKVQLVHRL